MPDLTVEQFEQRVKKTAWIGINRPEMAQVASDLRAAATHIDAVGWTQFKNFADPDRTGTSPCCAVGALHVTTRMGDGSRGRAMERTSNAVWLFDSVSQQTTLVDFNDRSTTTADQVIGALRDVAATIERYLEQTDV